MIDKYSSSADEIHLKSIGFEKNYGRLDLNEHPSPIISPYSCTFELI